MGSLRCFSLVDELRVLMALHGAWMVNGSPSFAARMFDNKMKGTMQKQRATHTHTQVTVPSLFLGIYFDWAAGRRMFRSSKTCAGRSLWTSSMKMLGIPDSNSPEGDLLQEKEESFGCRTSQKGSVRAKESYRM